MVRFYRPCPLVASGLLPLRRLEPPTLLTRARYSVIAIPGGLLIHPFVLLDSQKGSARRLGIRTAGDVLADTTRLVLDLRQLLGQLRVVDVAGVGERALDILTDVVEVDLDAFDGVLLATAHGSLVPLVMNGKGNPAS